MHIYNEKLKTDTNSFKHLYLKVVSQPISSSEQAQNIEQNLGKDNRAYCSSS